jgi:hypothetical protein
MSRPFEILTGVGMQLMRGERLTLRTVGELYSFSASACRDNRARFSRRTTGLR